MNILGTRLRYLPGNQNVVARDFISHNHINDTKKLDVLPFIALESCAASCKHEDLLQLKGMTLNLNK